ncbi:MAG: hypothetical protein J6J12_03960 [Oscillospiraceae bacterium]|nr:hypothetical protein [Oscillospiraceae bacterium]
MKIIPVYSPVLTLPQHGCGSEGARKTGASSKDPTLEQTCYVNKTDGPVTVFIENSPQRYGIPRPGGGFFCITCEGQFCQTEKTLYCSDNAVWFSDPWILYTRSEEGELVYNTNPRRRSAYNDSMVRTMDGQFLFHGYRVPLVYARDDIGIQETGELFIAEDYRKGLHGELLEQHRYIMALAWGELVITTNREAMCMTAGSQKRIHWGSKCRDAIDICYNNLGNFVLTAKGQVFYTLTGTRWKSLCGNAVAIATRRYTEELAVADQDGNIWIWNWEQVGKKGRVLPTEELLLSFPGKYISEVAISDRLVAVKFSDCTYSVYDRKQKQFCFRDGRNRQKGEYVPEM